MLVKLMKMSSIVSWPTGLICEMMSIRPTSNSARLCNKLPSCPKKEFIIVSSDAHQAPVKHVISSDIT